MLRSISATVRFRWSMRSIFIGGPPRLADIRSLTRNRRVWPAGAKSCKVFCMLSEAQARFLASCRVGHLATADARAMPHLVPVCFVVSEGALYITIEQKPK